MDDRLAIQVLCVAAIVCITLLFCAEMISRELRRIVDKITPPAGDDKETK